MGRHPGENRQYNISHMWEVHHQILRLAIMGMHSVDIAAQLNISEATVSYTLNSPISKRQLSIMRAACDVAAVDVAQRIKELAPKATERLAKLIESDSESISLRASQDILDRAGHGAIKKEMTLTGHLTQDDIEDIKARARQTGLCKEITDSSVIEIPV